MVKIMFLCTGNSCRSQMAEGLARELGKGVIEAHSAGLGPSFVHPRAIAAMAEIGIDISGQTSKGVDDRLLNSMDYVITLCGNAAYLCPVTPPHIRRIHWPIDDPAYASGTEEEIMAQFRAARDDIRQRVRQLLETIA